MSGAPTYDPQFVRPLHTGGDQFLEALVDRFEIHRDGRGIRLVVSFDDDTPAIGSSAGRRHVRGVIDAFADNARRLRSALDRYLEFRAGGFAHYDPGFPFRYVSGGVLPILAIGGRQYYCLIYRECFPVGWNLANGASESVEELLNPSITIERELREELLIVDRKYERLSVFDFDSDLDPDPSEHNAALALWDRQLASKGWSSILGFERVQIDLEWIGGPDTVEARTRGGTPVTTTGCYLNINPEDFGIEIDRIARITVNPTATICDGELTGDRLIDSVIGLFEVDRFNESLADGARQFMPDRFFYGGAVHSPARLPVLEGIIREDFVPRMQSYIPTWDRGEWDDAADKFDLCPATRALVKRAAAM